MTWNHVWRPNDRHEERLLADWDATSWHAWSFIPTFHSESREIWRLAMRRTRTGRWWELSFGVSRGQRAGGDPEAVPLSAVRKLRAASGYTAIERWLTEIRAMPDGMSPVDTYAFDDGAGHFVVVRCPYCACVHVHGPKPGPRVAHCLRMTPNPGYTLIEMPAIDGRTRRHLNQVLANMRGSRLARTELFWFELSAR